MAAKTSDFNRICHERIGIGFEVDSRRPLARERFQESVDNEHGGYFARRCLTHRIGNAPDTAAIVLAITSFNAFFHLGQQLWYAIEGEFRKDPSNGLLLRADLHTLFDLDLIAIQPATKKLVISKKLKDDPYYSRFQNERLRCGSSAVISKTALKIKYEAFLDAEAEP